MTYNRMEAKPRAGEHGRFCGDAKAPLVKTPCCDQWMCCDTAFFSFRGGGRCQVEHERFSLCYSHYEDQHGGPWQSCQKCRELWSKVNEVQIPGTKNALYRAFLDSLSFPYSCNTRVSIFCWGRACSFEIN